MSDSNQELIVLLNEQLQEIGSAPKLASHHANTPLHKAFSCYVFDNKGKFLITQRALSKKVWPGVWTNSLCGHPAPGESDQAAIARRADQELGMQVTDIRSLLPDYRYTTPPFEGIIENEFCPVYIARLQSGPQPNPAEVEELRWLSWPEYLQDIEQRAGQYSYWAKDQLKQLKDHPLIRQYSQEM